MTDKIEPALSAEEWRDAKDPELSDSLSYELSYLWGRSRPDAAIAILNDSLPDTAPRKITRADVENLRDLVAAVRALPRHLTRAISLKGGDRLADALESYLPPETPKE